MFFARIFVLFLVLVLGWFALSPQVIMMTSSDKQDHVVAFFSLAVATRLAWSATNLKVLFTFFASLTLAIELAQWEMALGRNAELADWLYGISAAMVGLIVAEIVRRWVSEIRQ